jgi:hypothetical protein
MHHFSKVLHKNNWMHVIFEGLTKQYTWQYRSCKLYWGVLAFWLVNCGDKQKCCFISLQHSHVTEYYARFPFCWKWICLYNVIQKSLCTHRHTHPRWCTWLVCIMWLWRWRLPSFNQLCCVSKFTMRNIFVFFQVHREFKLSCTTASSVSVWLLCEICR